MVMASGPGRRPSAADSPREVRRIGRSVGGGSAGPGQAGTLHERLVAYVAALDSAHDLRSSVWAEHSYARAGLAAGPGAVRVLLAHRDPPDFGDRLDVERDDPPPPDPPPLSDDSDDGEPDADEDEWERRLAGLAPGPAHARLADGVTDSLRRLRLARLTGGRVGGAFARRAEARALRRALAPLWLGCGPAPPPPQWLHAALAACAPRSVRRDYDRLVAELRRAVPRLADRLTAGRPPATPLAPQPIVDRTVEKQLGPERGPWLVWVGGGRWARRLGALVHTRRVRVRGVAGAPDAWCAAAAGGVRAAVAEVMAEAGERPVVLGGAGGCAALAASLASGARGLLALGPVPAAAEGARAGLGWAGPALLVAGGAAAGASRGALAEALGARQRLLLVTGADDALRLPARHAARLRLDQRALDAAIAEECARWILEECEASEADEPADECDAPLAVAAGGVYSDEEEYAHLPAAAGEPRGLEAGEGRVVSRVSGGTPLALVPPRRAAARPEPRRERRPERRAEPAAPPAPLAAADIMHMPIVFADDDRSVPPPPEPMGAASAGVVTVRSGGRGAGGFKYTRVIVAKRGAAGAAAGGRPLLLRRGVRLVPREPLDPR